MNRGAFALPLMAFLAATAPQHPVSTRGTNPEHSFVLDGSKPYVYLEFQRQGSRQPLRAGESQTGIWLALRNNCRLPIIISVLGSASESAQYTLVDEVVHDPPASDAPVVVHLGTPTPESAQASPAPPYNDEVRTAVTIAPGAAVTFSIPLNQVGPTWHVEIPFRFDLKGWKGRQPRSALAFYQSDIPAKP